MPKAHKKSPIQLVVFMQNLISISKASKYLGKSASYLRQLEENGVLIPTEYTTGGHRRYSIEALDQFQKAMESSGVCGVFLGIPDLDFPASHADQMRAKLYQRLMGMGFVGLEDVTPTIYDGNFYSVLPKLLTFATRNDVTCIAVSSAEVIPQESLSTLLFTCARFDVQVLFSNLR